MLSDSKKAVIQTDIQKLDYLEGTGLLSNNRRSLARELFVFIGAGGTGCKALARLKQTMVNQVSQQDIKKQVMFLAIDTAMKELDEWVANDVFFDNEVLKIPYEGAHDSINPIKILPQMEKWVHKNLWAETGGEAAVSKEFNGTGAGGKRQCGRVLFAQSAAQSDLRGQLSRIKEYAAEMGSTDRIQIFFLGGIAGGTGSGIILDLAFLTRHFLKGILGPAYSRVTLSAYLFLPSASGDASSIKQEATMNGNCNAYAALKEIDHYMTLTDRNEHYEMNYGTIYASNVDISENVFDFCTLVEGIGDGGTFFKNNAEVSRQIVADSILNVICAANSIPGADDHPLFLIDSFLSNVTTQATSQIIQHSDRLWPRDTNYIYSVIGYSSCVVPIDLLTTYVLKKIFDEVFGKFRQAEEVSDESVIDFLNACELGVKDLKRKSATLSKQQMFKDIQAQADAEFLEYGPFYMVNLTKSAAEMIENAPDDYLHKAQKKQSQLLNSNKWIMIAKRYQEAVDYLNKINQELYIVYTYAITVLRDIIEGNAKLITETKEYTQQFGKTFCWSPIDLTPGEQATAAVAEYLDGILDEKAVKKKARLFMQEMCDRKEEWTGIERSSRHGTLTFCVAKTIREFISNNLQECINTTLEDFLVKAYSKKRDALPFTYDSKTGQEICSSDTMKAARNILERLSRNASALAQTYQFRLEECYSNIYLMLPDNCPWLYEAIVKLASTFGINEKNIYKSSARESVAFCRLYAGVPAWALYWTSGAEEQYEGVNGQGPLKTGLHMDQGDGGTNWANLPNLYPEKLWTPAQRSIRQREAGISQNVRFNMEKAKKLGLLFRDTVNPEYYHVWLLKEHVDFDQLMGSLQLKGNKKYTLKDVLPVILQTDYFMDFKVDFVNMVMSTTDKLEDEQLEDFYFELSCRTIRRRWRQYQQLENTLLAMGQLEAFCEEHNQTVIEDSVLSLFINCLKWGILIYDSRRSLWKGTLGNERIIGQRLEDKFHQICAHFHGFYAFASLEDEIRADYAEYIAELSENASDEQFDLAQQTLAELKQSLILLAGAKKSTVKPWPDNSPFKIGNENPWPMATLDFTEKAGGEEQAGIIRSFYTELINNL